jgi:hypothetical protein
VKHPEIFLDGIQIKSEAKFHKLAAALNTIEEECGIKETWITLNHVFFCPWINRDHCHKTPMEDLLIGIIERLQSEQPGKAGKHTPRGRK